MPGQQRNRPPWPAENRKAILAMIEAGRRPTFGEPLEDPIDEAALQDAVRRLLPEAMALVDTKNATTYQETER